MSARSVASYVIGQCTYYVAKTLSWVPAGLGDAKDWLVNAQRKGYTISATPHRGDVVVYGPGHGYSSLGHVAVVESVQPGNKFTVSEMNFTGVGQIDKRESTMQGVMGFIEPPNSQQPTGSSPGQNPVIAFEQFLQHLAGNTLTAASPDTNPNFVDIQIPGTSIKISNPLNAFFNTAKSVWWRGLLILFGFIIIVVGIVVLFRQGIEKIEEPGHSALTASGSNGGSAGEAGEAGETSAASEAPLAAAAA